MLSLIFFAFQVSAAESVYHYYWDGGETSAYQKSCKKLSASSKEYLGHKAKLTKANSKTGLLGEVTEDNGEWETRHFYFSNENSCNTELKKIVDNFAQLNRPYDAAAMHGDKMSVRHIVKEAKEREVTFAVSEMIGKKDQKPVFKQVQELTVPLKAHQDLAAFNGFSCFTKVSDAAAYAIFAKKNAKRKSDFQPDQAWLIDEKAIRLVSVEPQKVNCRWNPNGDENYPYSEPKVSQ